MKSGKKQNRNKSLTVRDTQRRQCPHTCRPCGRSILPRSGVLWVPIGASGQRVSPARTPGALSLSGMTWDGQEPAVGSGLGPSPTGNLGLGAAALCPGRID